MRSRYLSDPEAHAADNAAGRPHWPAYTPLILETIGLLASPIEPAEMALEHWESETAILFLTGPVDVHPAQLQQWVERGGILVVWGPPDRPGSGAQSAAIHALLGARLGDILTQADDFSVGAQVAHRDHRLTVGVASPLAPGRPLLAFSP